MRLLLSTLVLSVIVHAGSTASAQDVLPKSPAGHENASELSFSEGMKPTPEMWFYMQERQRYQDPQAAVRRKAEFRSQQRQQRIASMKAFGMSKQRPLVYSTVFNTYYRAASNYPWLTVVPPAYVVESPTVSGQLIDP